MLAKYSSKQYCNKWSYKFIVLYVCRCIFRIYLPKKGTAGCVIQLKLVGMFFHLGDEYLWVHAIHGGSMPSEYRCVTRSVEYRQTRVVTWRKSHLSHQRSWAPNENWNLSSSFSQAKAVVAAGDYHADTEMKDEQKKDAAGSQSQVETEA